MTTWINQSGGVQTWTGTSVEETTWTRLDGGIETTDVTGFGLGGFGEGPFGIGGTTVTTITVTPVWTPFTTR